MHCSRDGLSALQHSPCAAAVGRWLLGLTLGFVWMGVSSGLIILNKQLMSVDGFHYPMALSALGMSFSSVASYFCCRVWRLTTAPLTSATILHSLKKRTPALQVCRLLGLYMVTFSSVTEAAARWAMAAHIRWCPFWDVHDTSCAARKSAEAVSTGLVGLCLLQVPSHEREQNLRASAAST